MFTWSMMRNLTIGWLILLLLMRGVKLAQEKIVDGGVNDLTIVSSAIFLCFAAVAIYGIVSRKNIGYFSTLTVLGFLSFGGLFGLISLMYTLSYPDFLEASFFWIILIQCIVSSVFLYGWVKHGRFNVAGI
ncbi:hypothetical protein [Colwellia sp. MB02u-9]|uniref:hypothetical protein n=1 Tax=Colwellia sp. MB02u-9 TaxID=2759823 RepID=UPI0015F67075|nr:hypothetical protein [Colwellia sp. MB02u-9]MBA6296069.1 hypothetical protein [Colwellia sp. MB02u-9]